MKGKQPVSYVVLVVLIVVGVCGTYGLGLGTGYLLGPILSPTMAEGRGLPSPSGTIVRPTSPAHPRLDGGSAPTPEEMRAFEVFWEAWSELKQNYYGDLPDVDQLTDGAIRGMLWTLDDRFTSYISPDMARIVQEDASGVFEGIGALLRINDDNLVEITRPFQGQPAEQAGVQAGDFVTAVDGEPIAGYGLFEVIGKIRGPAGTPVILTLVRRGVEDPFEVTITRAKIEIPIVESRMLPGAIAYVRLYEFSAPATNRVEAALSELLAEQPVGLVLDLRDNPGGFLQQAIEVSDLFMPEGVILIERIHDGRQETFRATTKGLAQDIPMIVLVNGGSASASEIVAGALQDSGRARLVGEQTFGKGSVQLSKTLSNGAELRVTVARWFTPNDRAIHGQGLLPDVEVPLTADDAQAGRDPQLDRAVQDLGAAP